MKHVAILYKRINLGYGNYTFRPIRVLEGYYDSEKDLFMTRENGNTKIYEPVQNIYSKTDYDLYFDFPERIEDLKEEFDYALTKEEVKLEYLTDRAKMHVDATVDDNMTYSVIYPRIVTQEVQNDETVKASIPEIKMSLQQLRDCVLKKVVSQDRAVEIVTRTIYKNYRAQDPANKSHILIAGPTGTGKTMLVETICKLIGIPFYKVDATDYTSEGYKGRNVNDMIVGLINACNGDLAAAEHGILAIDEIDKKRTRGGDEIIATQAVMDALLKVTGRGKIEVTIPNGFSERTILFDTAHLTVVCMGAFPGIVDEIDKRINLGFGSEEKKTVKSYIDLKPEHFIKFGMTPELIGRIPCRAYMKKLDEQDLKNIITNSEDSQLKHAAKFYSDNGVEFIATDDYINAVAHVSMENETGARGLKTTISDSLSLADDEILIKNDPNNTDQKVKIKKLTVTAETVENPKKYYVE